MRMLINNFRKPGGIVEWEPTEDDRKQAMKNHYQTLERLCDRGGLSWCELAAVIQHRQWEPISEEQARAACADRVRIIKEARDGTA